MLVFDDVPRPSARGLLGNNAISGKNWVLATSLDAKLARLPARNSETKIELEKKQPV